MPRNSDKNSEHEELLLPEQDSSGEESPANGQQVHSATEEVPATVSGEQYRRLREERDSFLDRLARLQAEFENYRKRNAREQGEFREYATAEAAKNFLPVLDNFNLALRADAPEKKLRDGIELIRKQMEEVLARLGVQPVPATGEQFDPRVHEAIEMVDTSDVPDHQIIEELQRGYKLKDRLLRPAMVRVARNVNTKAS
jgi:molecular chaperone GrpE